MPGSLERLIRHRVLIILSVTLLVAALVVPGFLRWNTLALGLDRGASIGLIAIGVTVLLIARQIDLSVGSIFGLCGIIAVMLQPALGVWPAAAAGVLAGAALGAINGLLTVVFRINALVATLATMLAFRAIAHWLTQSQPVPGSDIMLSITLSTVFLDVFTLRSLLFLGLIVGLHAWLTLTVAGRNLFAVGSNPDAATASGISPDRTVLLAFIFAGGLAGMAGVLQSLITNTGSPMFGSEILVVVIAAVVVGGTRIEGGKGSALGTLGGVLTITALTTAMEFRSVPAYVQQVVMGSILILLVVLDRTIRPGTTARAAPVP
ncbi:MAG: ABC transporter permease [Rhodobacteraceae bacterium]|jgi:ribose/xylose/arabinose/galactoside ABC-type transport system permease subunit|nr:ABC transporter permease [Paracoccaceae bacterium]